MNSPLRAGLAGLGCRSWRAIARANKLDSPRSEQCSRHPSPWRSEVGPHEKHSRAMPFLFFGAQVIGSFSHTSR
jgi:hypothetical protein